MERCLEHERLEGSDCVAVCDADERISSSGRCEPRCKAGEVVVGDECRVACPDGEEYFEDACVAECSSLEQRVEGMCRGPTDIRVDGVGYLPQGEKIAVLSKDPGSVAVVSVDDDRVVFEGRATGPELDPTLGVELFRFDFSELGTEGRYVIRSDDAGESPAFAIGADVYESALELAMLGFYGLRCNTEVELSHGGERFAHDTCHEGDGFREVGSSEVVSSLRGWHDAGDYGKYTQNGAFSAGMLLLAFEHFEGVLSEFAIDQLPESGGALPDFLDEVKWELDWLFTMQLDDGSTSHKLTAQNFEGFVLPERDLSPRYFAPASSEGTGSFVAVMAMAARVYEPFDPDFAARCLEAAERGAAFLEANPLHVAPDLSDFNTGAYTSNDADDRLWALAEMWATTGSADALAAFEMSALNLVVRDDWDWSDLSNLAVFSYLSSDREGRSSEAVDALEAAVVASADRLVETADAHPFLRALGETYYWGANGLVARSILNLSVAYRLTADEHYRRVAQHQLHHLFGVNAQGRSFVTGVGFLPPLLPHHRPSGADDVEPPWPGLLVGGPNPDLPRNDPAVGIVQDPDAPAPLMWQDAQASYWSNEIAINWNAPLVYGLAWFAAP